MEMNCVYLYLLSPLHTGGTTQEGNLAGIARESHTNLPYIPSSTIRGRLRASADSYIQSHLFGPLLEGNNELTQGNIWIGDGSLLWLPVSSLSHSVVWVSCPMLLKRWSRFNPALPEIPPEYSTSLGNRNAIYLKDAILSAAELEEWDDWQDFVPQDQANQAIERVLLLPDKYYPTLIQMSLWRQVKIKLDGTKSVDGGFRYEEAIPPDTLMYFTWGLTAQAQAQDNDYEAKFQQLLDQLSVFQIGGQESLGRGFVKQVQM